MFPTNILEINDQFLLHRISEILIDNISSDMNLDIEKLYDFECSYEQEMFCYNAGDFEYRSYTHPRFIYSFSTGFTLILPNFKRIIIENNKALNIELTLGKKYNYENLNARVCIVVRNNSLMLEISRNILLYEEEDYKDLIDRIEEFLTNYLFHRFRHIIDKSHIQVLELLQKR